MQKDSKKRIVICSLILQFGGAERVISVLSKELCAYYENIEILLYYDREICYEIDPSVKVTIIEKENHTQSKIRNLFWIRSYLKKNADVVISFLAPLNMLILAALIGVRLHKIVADRSDPRRAPTRLILRKVRDFLYYFANMVVVQTKSSYEYFPSKVQRKIEIIYNPTSVKKEDMGLALRTAKEDVVVCVGRMIEVKNPFMVFHAFELFHRKFPSYRLIWYGEGEMREGMEKWIAERGLKDFIMMPGTTKEIAHQIASARMFVMTSNYEGMSNALIEAMSIGLPCVCTKVSGATELIIDGKNGVLIDIGDVEGCSEAMMRIAEEEQYGKRLGENAIRLAEKLSKENILKKWIEII